jgi:DNA-binding XRE family transcriptional regulator
VEAINEKLSQCEQLCLADVDRHLDFDCHRYIRLLCRRGYLTSAMGENRRISGYVRSKIWPPPPEFFEAGAIGVAYFLQTWFRYYLQTWIETSMSQLETHEGVYSWNYSGNDMAHQRLRGTTTDGGFVRDEDAEEVVSTHHLDEIGGVDNTMVDKALDLSVMTLDWVNATEDPIFKDLSMSDRLFLYMSHSYPQVKQWPGSDLRTEPRFDSARSLLIASFHLDYETTKLIIPGDIPMNPTVITTEAPLHILLRQRRQELSLVQSQLAEVLHVSPECIAQWECGRRRMELSKLPRIAAALQLDARELCTKALAEFHPLLYASLFGDDALAEHQPEPR